MHFLLRSFIYIFEISMKRRIFWCPIRLFKEKKFSSLRRDNKLFWELKKVKNGRNRSKFWKTVFYKQILDFHCPSKILCHTSNLWNFVKITGRYPPTLLKLEQFITVFNLYNLIVGIRQTYSATEWAAMTYITLEGRQLKDMLLGYKWFNMVSLS